MNEQTKHTPGPWQFSKTNIGGGTWGDEYGIITPKPMAGISVRISAPDVSESEAIANARLIAAAPDLLAACRMALPLNLETANPNIPDSAEVPCLFTMGELRAIRTAIAKATAPA